MGQPASELRCPDIRKAGQPNRSATQAAADRLGSDYERLLARDPVRRGHGIFYTPPEVVDYIVDLTLGPLLADKAPNDASSLRILDPCCGCGAFLLGAHRWLCRWIASHCGQVPTHRQKQAIARQLAGIDIDPVAVNLTRQALGQEAGLLPRDLADDIRRGDALLDHDGWLAGRFDAVVTNPPYVNIRRLSGAASAEQVAAYRRRYCCAVGAFDLYVLFLERSIAALRRGGRLGAIVPNKLATLDYARPCRELLLTKGTLDTIADVSHLRIFGAAEVYPYIVGWTKRTPPADHAIRIIRPPLPAPIESPDRSAALPTFVLQSQQRADRGLILSADLHVEARVATAPLEAVATIHSGATGFQAAELAAHLAETEGPRLPSERTEYFDFITSGNIDPYSIRLGDVRFIGRKFRRPRLCAADSLLSEKKRQFYAAPKIVLAGMARRLEAALDNWGLALGVQVYAVTEWKVDPHYLLALLNSSLLSHLFRLRFAAKRLAGGYFSLSKRQLAQLPIRILDLTNPSECRLHEQLLDLVQRRLKPVAKKAKSAAIDGQIDALVMRLYKVDPAEVEQLPAAA